MLLGIFVELSDYFHLVFSSTDPICDAENMIYHIFYHHMSKQLNTTIFTTGQPIYSYTTFSGIRDFSWTVEALLHLTAQFPHFCHTFHRSGDLRLFTHTVSTAGVIQAFSISFLSFSSLLYAFSLHYIPAHSTVLLYKTSATAHSTATRSYRAPWQLLATSANSEGAITKEISLSS